LGAITVCIAWKTSADSMTGEIKEKTLSLHWLQGASQGTTFNLPDFRLNREVLGGDRTTDQQNNSKLQPPLDQVQLNFIVYKEY